MNTDVRIYLENEEFKNVSICKLGTGFVTVSIGSDFINRVTFYADNLAAVKSLVYKLKAELEKLTHPINTPDSKILHCPHCHYPLP